MFLNVPFDAQYRRLLLALVAGLTALGRKPHCVLEVASAGQNRLQRIYQLLARCESSIHDLSRVTRSGPLRVPRFNMPFETGLAFSLGQHGAHRRYIYLFEEQPHRLEHSLNDLNGHDPHVHGGTQQGILGCLLDCFENPAGNPPIATMKSLTRKLSRSMSREKDLFHADMFRRMVSSANQLAQAEGLTDSR